MSPPPIGTASVAGWTPSALPGPLQVFSGEFLYWALVFFALAVVAAVLGFRGVAGISMEIARLLVLVFLVLAVVALLL